MNVIFLCAKITQTMDEEQRKEGNFIYFCNINALNFVWGFVNCFSVCYFFPRSNEETKLSMVHSIISLDTLKCNVRNRQEWMNERQRHDFQVSWHFRWYQVRENLPVAYPKAIVFVCVYCFALVNDVRWNETINYGFGCLISFLMTFFTVSESVLVSRVLCGSFAFSTHDSQPLTLLATLYFQPHNYRAHRNTFSRGIVCISHANRDT